MAATTLRVHILAKELGVPSKTIIAKCAAEGIELKNHMAALSVGLAESIREWFSAGVDVTSVEQAARVDVEKVRAARRKKKAPAQAPAEAVPEQPPVAAEAVTEAGAPTVITPEAPTMPTEVGPPEPVPIAPPEGLGEVPVPEVGPVPEVEKLAAKAPLPTVGAPAEGSVEGEAEGAEARPAAVAEEPPPKPIVPAGPRLIPRPAELQGPRLVRVEAPEPVGYPRPRPSSLVARGPMERATTTVAPPAETTAARRGRGKSRMAAEEEAVSTRSRSPRRHGTVVDVDQRVREWRDQDLLERKERLASVTGHGLRDRRAAERRRQATSQTVAVQPVRKEPVALTAPLTVKEFCAAVGTPFAVVSKKLLDHTGRLWTINQSLDGEQVELLALDLGVPVTVSRAKTAYEALREQFVNRERGNFEPRPPVVAMLGHVDHGKTSLLDAIRRTRVAAGEAGGITQHIGAYRVDRGNWHVTFVDTPGHEAFTAMRARGANLTDVVVLVVAADDGVMPQTVEAINHAKAAGVPIVVALNKIDLPGIDVNRIYAQLAEHELTPSEWGGTTDVIKTSAIRGDGIDELIAHLSTLSELLELKADPRAPAWASVIEAQMREGQGVVAQVLVREGTLRCGQCIVCGPGVGRIRALTDDTGRQIKEAGPGTPVEVAGLDELPAAGDALYQVGSLAEAKAIAREVRQLRRAEALEVATGPRARTLEALMARAGESEVPELRVILKADVQGSVEVLKKSLGSLPADKARLTVLHAAVGAISEADVNLAKASEAMLIGFHVIAEERARQLADQLGVEVRCYRVIYEILEDLRGALAGMLVPERREEARATVEVRQIFHVSRVGTIAGCYVIDGVLQRNQRVRLVRDGRIILDSAAIASLKRFKDDAREVRAGLECGLKLEGFDDVKPGDIIQSFELIEVAPQS